VAAVRPVDELTRCALARHTIAVIGDEPPLAYNRVQYRAYAAVVMAQSGRYVKGLAARQPRSTSAAVKSRLQTRAFRFPGLGSLRDPRRCG
jgi:hypothetical protein